MYRAESARSNKTDDIPVARRADPFGLLSQRRVRLIVIFSVLSACSVMLFSMGLLVRLRGNNSLFSNKDMSSPDGRLLGHYPYPEAQSTDLISIYPTLQVHKDTYKALKSMRAAAAAEGVNLVLLSGYRSIELQRQIFYGTKSARNQIAIERAKVSAPPGHSEHSTGYAIDLGDAERRETDFEETFESTKAFRWLQKNAPRFHFVLSFPKGNPQKVSYEPWHWRYEGTVDALRQFETANENRRKHELSK